jgi:hypothetical protein
MENWSLPAKESVRGGVQTMELGWAPYLFILIAEGHPGYALPNT